MKSFDSLIFLNYALLFAATYACARLLKKTRYASSYAYFSLANVIQVGGGVAFLPAYVVENDFIFDALAYENFLYAQAIYSAIVAVSAFALTQRRALAASPDYELKAINDYAWFFMLVSVVFLALRVSAPASQFVLNNLTLAFGADHYSVRSDLISIGVENYSRLDIHFTNFARTSLTLALLVFSYNWAIFKSRPGKRMALFLLFVLAVDGLLKLQKAPVVILTLIAFSPFFLRRIREGAGGGRGRVVRTLTYIGAFSVVAVLSTIFLVAYVFQDMSFEQGLFLIFDRFVFIPELSSLMHFQAYPDMIPFVRLANMRIVADLFQLNTAPVYGTIPLDVAHANTGLLYNANAGFVASAWATYGYVGLVIYSVVAFLVFLAIDSLVRRRAGMAPVWPLAAYFASGFVAYSNVSFEDSLLLQGFVYIPFIYVFIAVRTIRKRRAALLV